MRWLIRSIAVALVLIASVAAPPLASAQPAADDGAYRATIDEAVREFSAGRFEEARALFKRAHELSPNARTLRGLGMTAFELRAYVQAIRELQAALDDKRKPLEGELRTKVEVLLDKSRKFVGVLRLELDPRNASVLVDGKSPTFEDDGSLLLDAGTHVISATAPKHKATNVRILVEGDTKQTVRVPLESTEFQQSMIAPIDAEQVAKEKEQKDALAVTEPPPEPAADDGGGSSTQTWAIGTLIGAGAFGAAAAIFWFLGDGQYKELEDGCKPGCSDKQIDDSGVKTSDLLTNVFLGLGAASLATSGVLFIVDAGESDGSGAAPQAAVRIGPLGASVSGSF
jgi:tetratricopeptide (TPR) repeat protein